MKNLFLLTMSLAAIGLTTSCGSGSATAEKSNNPVVPNQMTMTLTPKGEVNIRLGGEGDAVIDWGDGSEKETVTLTSFPAAFKHTFGDDAERTISITGENITNVNCQKINLSTLEVSQIRPLKELYCGTNALTTLNLSDNTELTKVYCENNKLTTLNLNAALTWLDCSSNQLTAIDVSKNTALTRLECGMNPLTTLDLSANTALTWLDCSSEQLTTLNIRNNTALQHLTCGRTPFTTFDLSANTALELVSFRWGKLQTLDLSANTALKNISLDENELTAEALNDIFKTLHGNDIEKKSILIARNPGTNGCDTSIATGKGWTVK
ncbi:MAG: hypothetical protein FWG84_01970 [Bacteroidales bacterium]|nr:hypothetical protein [Bacteroidales bacterium]